MSSRDQVDVEEFRDVRQLLRELPEREPAADLRMRLRVIASKESSRRYARATWYKRCRTWLSDFRLFADNLMRPLAIPTAGGFVSALLLFGVLAPMLSTPGTIVAGQDVPTQLYKGASVRSYMPLHINNEALTVEVTINDEGRVIGYSIPGGEDSNPEPRRSIENYLMFMEFTPVQNFGNPVKGKVPILFQSSQIDVRG